MTDLRNAAVRVQMTCNCAFSFQRARHFDAVVLHVPAGEGDNYHLRHIGSGTEIVLNPLCGEFIGMELLPVAATQEADQ